VRLTHTRSHENHENHEDDEDHEEHEEHEGHEEEPRVSPRLRDSLVPLLRGAAETPPMLFAERLAARCRVGRLVVEPGGRPSLPT
jgi:hypothetical protein